jgi:hypothetical protein
MRVKFSWHEVSTSEVISETPNAEAKQFDFLEGEWNAVCRFPLPDGSWGEGPGSLTVTVGAPFLRDFLRRAGVGNAGARWV